MDSNDNLMDNSNMATLSMEPRNWIITHYSNTITGSPLIQVAVGMLRDSRNVSTASKPSSYWMHMSYYHAKVIGTILSTCYTINNKRQCWDPILAAVSILKKLICG